MERNEILKTGVTSGEYIKDNCLIIPLSLIKDVSASLEYFSTDSRDALMHLEIDMIPMVN